MSFVLLLAAGIVAGGWLVGPFRFRDRAESLVYRLLAGLIVCVLVCGLALSISGVGILI
jgi:hypothetical protein